jgi:two-component system chemotaxis sensor kinase CheA
MMDQFQAKFIEEANDLIATLEKTLLALEQNIEDKSLVEKVFRVMHTLKGNSSMFGFEKMGAVTHHLETIYDFIREGKRPVTKDLLTVTFTSLDHFRVLLTDPHLTDTHSAAVHGQLLDQIHKLINQKEDALADTEAHNSEQPIKDTADNVETSTYYILFLPHEDILANGTNPLYLLDEICSLGTAEVVSHLQHIPDLASFNISKCYSYWEIYLASQADTNALKDVFIFVEEECEIKIEKLSGRNLMKDKGFSNKIAAQQRTQSDTDLSELQQYIGQLEASPKKKSEEQTTSIAKEQVVSSIRVASEKLDDLMNLVSELVTTQARLSLFSEQNSIPELVAIAENVEKISRQLRDSTFSICLVPLENILIRFQRLVRDLSTELNKDIILVTEGADTELDKSIIESLADPLLHILRNSMDHGIESAEARIQKGKPAQGKILLKAFYSGTNVHIEITDDGAGINPEKIRNKAISKGLISPDVSLSEKETLDLLFLPGFSTAEKVTDVSGRGVGMDVVKRKIAELRGEVILQSKVDVGTTITIKLPLTLSIIDGLLVKIEDTHFVIPLSLVDKCFEARHSQLVDTFNNLITLDGEKVPFFYLRKEFTMSQNKAAIEQIVVIKYDGKRVGLTVDAIVGEYQAVLKPLGKLYKKQEHISGATILGDGTIALVLDIHKMINQFLKTELVSI